MTQTAAAHDWLHHVEQTEGWLSLDEARLLHELAAEVESGAIVEVGAYRGRSAIALAAGARPGIPVYAIDPHAEMIKDGVSRFGPQDRAAFYEAMVRSGAYESVRLLNTSSEIITPGWTEPVSLLWIDGDHSEEGVRRDWACWQPRLVPGCVVAFDDAFDETIGPARLIADLFERGTIEQRQNVGKIRTVYYRA